MATFEEELANFEATEPTSADLGDIERGVRMLHQVSPDDTGRKVALYLRLGSFFLENKQLDPWESLKHAGDCYGAVISLAEEQQIAESNLLLGNSGAVNVLVRRYELGGDREDLDRAESVFHVLIDFCDKRGLVENSISNRMNYALLLSKAGHGDRYSNLDKAIVLLRRVVDDSSVQARGEAFDPKVYGRALYNLAVVLMKQSEEPHVRTMMVNEAVDVLQQALLFRTPERDPIGRIKVLRALAQALPEWVGAASLAHAQQLAEEAREEADALAQTYGVQGKAAWAQAAERESALFWDLDAFAADRANMEKAIADHSSTIGQIQRDSLPLLWAKWVGGYARLVGRVGVEDHNRELQERSRVAFGDALSAVSPEQDPKLWLILNRELGRVCHESGDWTSSLAANREAARIGAGLVDAAGTNVSRGNELEGVTRSIHFAVFAAAQLGNAAEAAELAEVGRARWLDEALQAAIIRTSSLPRETKTAVDEAQAAVLELERRVLNLQDEGAPGAVRRLENYLGVAFGASIKARATADPNGAEAKLKQELAAAREQLQQARAHLTTLLNSVEAREGLYRRLTCTQIQEIAQAAGFPIMYLLASAWGSTAIIVCERVEILPLPGLLRSTVQALLYGDNGFVKLCAGAEEGDLEESLRQIQATLDSHVMGPLAAWCSRNSTCKLAVVGLGDVGLLPIQVSTVPAGLELRLLPSARALLLSPAGQRSEGNKAKSLMTLGDPGTDALPGLPFSRVESSVFSALFTREGIDAVDLSDTPTLAMLEQHLASATHVHLACHGTFRPFSPLNSIVHLKGHEELQVESLLRPALKLKGTELVVLSACNSASAEPWQTPDESIGFPAAFLAAGARTVVAAQWKVSDAVTLLLMRRFCVRLLAGGSDAAGSLVYAQRWLYGASSTEIIDEIHEILNLLGEREARSRRFLNDFEDEIREGETAQPFAGLSYWAGFACVGG